MLCDRCHGRPSTIEFKFDDRKSGRQFAQRFCQLCFDEILLSYPEIAKELKDAVAEARPANVKAPPEWIPEAYPQLIKQRRGP
jgi:hypothetical protein